MFFLYRNFNIYKKIEIFIHNSILMKNLIMPRTYNFTAYNKTLSNGSSLKTRVRFNTNQNNSSVNSGSFYDMAVKAGCISSGISYSVNGGSLYG